MRKATQSKEFTKGSVRVLPTQSALRSECGRRAAALDVAALTTVTELLSGPETTAAETVRAIEQAERYVAAAQKLRKWSGQFQ